MPSEIKEKATATMNIAVVMVPLPAQGHLNPLLHLSSHLASRRIHVHYVSSATHNRQARHRFHGWNLTATAASHLHFHDFAFPSLPSPSPDPLLKFPSHLQPSFDAAAAHLLPHLSSLILSLSPSHHRIVLLHDSSMSFSNAAASRVSNAEAFAFHPGSATSNLCFLSQVDRFGVDFRSCFSGDFLAFLGRQQTTYSRVEGRLFNTCRSIEGASLDRLSEEPRLKGQKIFAVGPLNPVAAARRSDDECLCWLDEQPPASVLYVSFGTTSTMPREQLRELEAGLEAGGHPFIWVRRDADLCDIFHGGDDDGNEDFDSIEFEKRVEGRGKVVRGWAPQLEILSHPATGGFLSHCGWNSCMEAMSSGVPILAWPGHSDQPVNAGLVAEVLKTGITLKRRSNEEGGGGGAAAEREGLVTGAAVRESVARLMAGDGEGGEVRRRAREVGEKLRAAVMEGGSSRADLDAFLAYVSRP